MKASVPFKVELAKTAVNVPPPAVPRPLGRRDLEVAADVDQEVGATRPLGDFPQLLPAATSIAGSVIDLLALFRTDTEIKGKSFNVEEDALVAEVFRAWPLSGVLSDVDEAPTNLGGLGAQQVGQGGGHRASGVR